MTCPDCGGEMTKAAIQCEDLSGWVVGWLCDCKPCDNVELTIHAARDWTAGVLLDATIEDTEP